MGIGSCMAQSIPLIVKQKKTMTSLSMEVALQVICASHLGAPCAEDANCVSLGLAELHPSQNDDDTPQSSTELGSSISRPVPAILSFRPGLEAKRRKSHECFLNDELVQQASRGVVKLASLADIR